MLLLLSGTNEVTLEDKNVINLKLIECLLVLNLSIFENKSKYTLQTSKYKLFYLIMKVLILYRSLLVNILAYSMFN